MVSRTGGTQILMNQVPTVRFTFRSGFLEGSGVCEPEYAFSYFFTLYQVVYFFGDTCKCDNINNYYLMLFIYEVRSQMW